jgi:hypothetical protein
VLAKCAGDGESVHGMEFDLMCARAEEDGGDNRGRQLATRTKIDGHVQ